MSSEESSHGGHQCAYCGAPVDAGPFEPALRMTPMACKKWRCRVRGELEPSLATGVIVILLYIAIKDTIRRLKGLISRD